MPVAFRSHELYLMLKLNRQAMVDMLEYEVIISRELFFLVSPKHHLFGVFLPYSAAVFESLFEASRTTVGAFCLVGEAEV